MPSNKLPVFTYLAILSFLLLPAASFGAEVTYSLEPYSGFTPSAVNNDGVVVGTGTVDANPRSFYWTPETGAVRFEASHAYKYWANDINDSGLICGNTQYIPGAGGNVSAFVYDMHSGEYISLGYPSSQDYDYMASAYTIAERSDLLIGGRRRWTYNYAGTLFTAAGAILQKAGSGAASPTTIGGTSDVYGITSDGKLAGRINSSDAFYRDGTTVHTLPGLTTGATEVVSDMNESGTISGYADNADGVERAVTWVRSEAPTDLGVLANTHAAPGSQNSRAYEINRYGQVVGWSQLWLDGVSHRQTHAFVYQDGVMRDLNDLVPTGTPLLTYAYAINDKGQIATEDGLLTPHYVADAGFDSGTLGDWTQATATGTVGFTTDPEDTANTVLSLTTGSPVAAAQVVDTPNQPFIVEFDYRFDDLVGELTVSVNGHDLLPSVSPVSTEWMHAERLVNAPALMGLDDVSLQFYLDTAVGSSTVLLDNVAITPVPEPVSAVVLLVGLPAIIRRRRSKR